MNFDLVHIYQSMGTFALCVAGALVLMALASLAVLFERLFVLSRSSAANRSFAPIASELLDKAEHAKLVKEAAARGTSHLARLLSAGLQTYLTNTARPTHVAPVELARRELQRRAEAIHAELRRGMGVLASVGSLAPFVGLLGTVVGIIAAFEGIAAEGSGGLGAVSAGIAEALVVTALGLLVAIPAVLAFNFLTARVDATMLHLDAARGELVDALERGSPGQRQESVHAHAA